MKQIGKEINGDTKNYKQERTVDVTKEERNTQTKEREFERDKPDMYMHLLAVQV
jgi:hypothetical protein